MNCRFDQADKWFACGSFENALSSKQARDKHFSPTSQLLYAVSLLLHSSLLNCTLQVLQQVRGNETWILENFPLASLIITFKIRRLDFSTKLTPIDSPIPCLSWHWYLLISDYPRPDLPIQSSGFTQYMRFATSVQWCTAPSIFQLLRHLLLFFTKACRLNNTKCNNTY